MTISDHRDLHSRMCHERPDNKQIIVRIIHICVKQTPETGL